ncbi:MAG TPA: SRPBCC domain-containing protein, partial [Gemmatimonadales bacterium]|nr:SRPBCC domain-containing protein [Gemmatimonadales bacterium]
MPTTSSAAPKLLELTVSRTIDAAPAAVFDAWVDPAKVSKWFGARVIMNPVVDGLYYICVTHQGRNWPHYGRFLRIERPRLVEQTWMSESTHGLESIVTFGIEPRGRGSEVTIRHTGLPDEKERRNHQDGW